MALDTQLAAAVKQLSDDFAVFVAKQASVTPDAAVQTQIDAVNALDAQVKAATPA